MDCLQEDSMVFEECRNPTSCIRLQSEMIFFSDSECDSLIG